KGKSDTSNPLQTERVHPLQMERVTRSKWNPNNVSNNLVINTNKPNNESNNHHHHSEHETSRNADVSKWNDDDDYMMFRGLFLSAHADDIKRHDLHYQTFVGGKNKIGLAELIRTAKAYIKDKKDHSQIIWFLAGGYQQYLINQPKKKITN